MAGTQRNRMITCDDTLWNAFTAAVGPRKTSTTIRMLIAQYLGHPDVELPPPPDIRWRPVADVTGWEPAPPPIP